MKLAARLSAARRSGLTLIELVVVVAILAILAGLVIPQFDFLRKQADQAAGAAEMGQVSSNIQVFRTTFGNYPDHFDSLLDATGTNLYANLNSELNSGATAKLTTVTLSANMLKSLNDVGIGGVYDHAAGAEFPGSSGVNHREFALNAKLAGINTAAGSGGIGIIESIYPSPAGDGSGLPANVVLVAMGVGPKCTIVGKTMQSAPVYPGVDGNTVYNRIIAVFAVFTDGKPAALKGTIDSKGDVLNEELNEYQAAKPQ